MKTVLLGVTTQSKLAWKNKIKEIEKFEIREISLFPTSLDKEDRKEMYNLLECSSLQRIPHVHLRHDMQAWELDYLMEHFKTKVFNIRKRRRRKE